MATWRPPAQATRTLAKRQGSLWIQGLREQPAAAGQRRPVRPGANQAAEIGPRDRQNPAEVELVRLDQAKCRLRRIAAAKPPEDPGRHLQRGGVRRAARWPAPPRWPSCEPNQIGAPRMPRQQDAQLVLTRARYRSARIRCPRRRREAARQQLVQRQDRMRGTGNRRNARSGGRRYTTRPCSRRVRWSAIDSDFHVRDQIADERPGCRAPSCAPARRTPGCSRPKARQRRARDGRRAGNVRLRGAPAELGRLRRPRPRNPSHRPGADEFIRPPAACG